METVTCNGTSIPQQGFGTWPMKGAECERAVAVALEVGYRHIDTAQMYGNEKEVGIAISQSGLSRDEVFITTKVWPDCHSAQKFASAVEERLENLQVDSVDLLLLHWPSRETPFEETMPLLNAALSAGKARAIGISNFTSSQVLKAVELSDAPLAVNQVEYHPFLSQDKVRAACDVHGLGMTAYCPIARGFELDESPIGAIAKKYGKSAPQVTLRWHLQNGVIAIPKSATPARIIENFAITDFTLTDEEMKTISGLARPGSRQVDAEGIAPDWDD